MYRSSDQAAAVLVDSSSNNSPLPYSVLTTLGQKENISPAFLHNDLESQSRGTYAPIEPVPLNLDQTNQPKSFPNDPGISPNQDIVVVTKPAEMITPNEFIINPAANGELKKSDASLRKKWSFERPKTDCSTCTGIIKTTFCCFLFIVLFPLVCLIKCLIQIVFCLTCGCCGLCLRS